jgi:hypothetical protein
MADGPVKLVTPPTMEERARADVIDILKTMLEDARAGKIAAVVVLAQHVDRRWSHQESATTAFSEAIGQIEILKASWIETFRRRADSFEADR